MSMRDAYRQKVEAQIEELNARLKLAQAKAKQLAADGKIAAFEEIAETEKHLVTLKAKLAAMGKASEGAWTDLKAGVDLAWKDMEQAAKRAFDRFG